jgi:fumarate reductase flavoprotein subunit
MKTSRRIFVPVAVLVFLLAALPGCGTGDGSSRSTGEEAPAGEYQDGVYEGSGQGWRGPVLVRLRLEAGEIAESEILEHQDDAFVGGSAMEELAELVLEYNAVDLDAVSGATESSAGFLAAVEDALAQARSPHE